MSLPKYVVIDTETTGNAPQDGDNIIQIGAVLMEDDSIVDTFSAYIRPAHSIPPFIMELTGITNEDVEKAEPFAIAAAPMLAWLEDAVLVAHNVPFDLSVLNAELSNAGLPLFQGQTLDTVECARFMFPTAPGYQLTQLADWLHISHDRPHQADSDAIVTAEIWLAIKQKIETLPVAALQKLMTASKYMQSHLEPVFMQAKNNLRLQESENIHVIHNIALRSPEASFVKETPPSFDMKSLFSRDGYFSEKWEEFEFREGQQEMADKITSCFSQRSHALIEAGPGTGKSLAYLAPAVLRSLEQQEQIVISTYTNALQEQLYERDIPFLKTILPFSFKVSILKGRQHYLCLRRFSMQWQEPVATHDEALALAQVTVWLLETQTGDLNELNRAGGDNHAIWQKMCSRRATAPGPGSSWFPYCFYERAKKQAAESQIVIVNHALLFSDVKRKNSILPPYERLIIDEAHQIEEAASKHLGADVDYYSFQYLLNKIDAGTGKGSFFKLQLIEEETVHSLTDIWYQKRRDHIALLKYECSELFRLLRQICIKNSHSGRTDVGRMLYRYEPAAQNGPAWKATREAVHRLEMVFREENKEWEYFKQVLQKNTAPSDYNEALLTDFKQTADDLSEAFSELSQVTLEQEEGHVYWMEADHKGAANGVAIYKRPLDVSDDLADKLFGAKSSVIMTSATLMVEQSFSYVVSKWGLEDFTPETLYIPSPYSYKNRSALLIPSDFPGVRSNKYVEAMADFIYHTASVTEGRVLILFTSFDMLSETYHMLREWDEMNSFTIIAQGIHSGSKSKLLKTFQQNKRTILLGTNAFWEGIDLPGDQLRCLIIARLPFSPPGDPLIHSQMQRIEKQGGSAFQEMSLPQAILRFRQGFGRMIRGHSDRGTVVVLDKRIMTAPYGNAFLDSLPEMPVVHKQADALLNYIHDFYNETN